MKNNGNNHTQSVSIRQRIMRGVLSFVLISTVLFSAMPCAQAAEISRQFLPAGEYLQMGFTQPGDNEECQPQFAVAELPDEPYRKVEEALMFLTDGGCENISLTVAAPPLNSGDTLALYAVEDGALSQEPIARGLSTGDSIGVSFDLQGVALVREYAAETVEERTAAVQLKDGAEVKLSGYMPPEATVTVEEKQNDEQSVLYDLDITIRDQAGNEFQPLTGCPITVSVTSGTMQAYAEKGATLEAQHILSDGSSQRVPVTLSANGTGAFSAEGFSEYIIRESEGAALATPRRTYHFLHYDYTALSDTGSYESGMFEFLNKANDLVSYQIIRDGDPLEHIPIPPNKETEYFYGWYIVEPVSVNGDTVTYRWTEDPERVSFGVPLSVEESEDTDVYVAPLYSNYRFVTFHQSEEGDSTGKNVLTRRLITLGSDDQAVVTISDVRAQPPDAQRIVFWGWKLNDQEWQTVANDGTEIPTTVTVNGTDAEANFYPSFRHARWITFVAGESGSGAKYVPSQFVVEGDSVSSLPVSERVGYSFLGWYSGDTQVTNSSGTVLSGTVDLGNGNTMRSGRLTLENNITLTAKWQVVSSAKYTVIIWKQKVTDSKDAVEEDKTYDFEDRIERSGVPNTDVTSSSADRSKNYTGFTYNRTTVTNNGKISPDGSTVINVFYDRDLMAINFYYRSTDARPTNTTTAYLYSTTTSTSGTQYGLVDDSYVQLTPVSDTVTTIKFTYKYTPTTSTSGTQYGVNSSHEYVQLTSSGSGNNKKWYLNNQQYTGTRYTRSSNGDNYEGTRYKKSGNIYVETTDTTGTLYGLSDGNYIPLTVSTGSTVVGWETPGGEPYNGVRFTRSSVSTTYKYMLTWTGLYGSTLAQNGYSWATVSNIRWNVNSGGSGTTQTMLDSFIETSNPYILYSQGSNGTNYIYHYMQNLDGSYSQDNCVIARYNSTSGTFNFTNKFSGFTVASYNTSTEGFHSTGGSTAVTPGTSKSMNLPIYIYHTRNKYSLTLVDNCLDGSTHVIENIPYGAHLSDYVDQNASYMHPTTPHYEFKGWCEDNEGQRLFNFDSTMPAANKIIYGGWNKIWYFIQIDPNGAEIYHPDTSYATYFWLSYGANIGEYRNVTREYVPDDDGEFVYLYITFHDENNGYGINSSLRNAVYLRPSELEDYYNEHYADSGMTREDFYSCVSNQHYRRANVTEQYSLLGWYRVRDNGTLYPTPYNFADAVDSNVKLRAVWRLTGTYYISYNTTMTGTSVTGAIPQLIDPADNGKYIDQATAIVLSAPHDITDGYIFEGWRLVDQYGNPLEDGTLYDPGDEFTVDAQLADDLGCIHMEAYYVQDPYASSRKVSVTSLILDANGGFVNDEGLAASDTYIYSDAALNQLHFEKQMNNMDIHLGNYAQNFSHNGGKRLIGWHPTPHCENLNPMYRVDAVLGINHNSENILYAVWEPEVYLTLVNNTTETLTANLGFSDGAGAVYLVTSEYEREPFVSDSVTLAAGESVKLSVPAGAGATYSVSGVYSGSKDKLYIYNTGGAGATARRGYSYQVGGTLFTSPTGAIVSFYDKEEEIPAPTGVRMNYAWTAIPAILLAGLAAALALRLLRRRKDHIDNPL